jgi:twinkle protein
MISIPYYVDGRVVNHKYRTLEGKKRFEMDKGGKLVAWNLECLRETSLKGKHLLICEGELDALAAIQSGYARAISVPNGAPMKAGELEGRRYDWLDSLAKLLDDRAIVILATDADAPGEALKQDLIKFFGRHRVRTIEYPEPTSSDTTIKDLNDVLLHFGEAAVLECIEGAKRHARRGVFKMSEIPDEPPKTLYELPGVVEGNLNFRTGDFWVVTGVPGHGKTTFVDDTMCRLALTHGLRICYTSFEKLPKPYHNKDLVQWRVSMLRGGPADLPHSPAEQDAAKQFIDEHFRFITLNDADGDPSLDWLIEMMEEAVLEHQCNVIVIDPWNEMAHTRDRGTSLTEYVGESIRRLKRFARRYDVTVVVVAHPAKLKPDEVATLYSISDSAHWYNKADIGIIVSRDRATNNTAVDIAKVRFSDLGNVSKINCRLMPSGKRFVHLEQEDLLAD